MSQIVQLPSAGQSEKPPRPPATRRAASAAENVGPPPRKVPRLIELAARALSLPEIAFAENFSQTRNAGVAYRESHDCTSMSPEAVRQAGWRCAARPNVQRYVRELLSDAARASVVDVAALLASDRELVEAFDLHVHELMQHVIECCRYCNGIGYRYQWIDLDEFLAALDLAEAENDARREKQQRIKPLPDDAGGYGYKRSNDPSAQCPKCEGRGHAATYFADTSKLTGPAARLFKGVKHTANGFEMLTPDVDKARDRLMRAAGAFGDDAASVARGAAAGAAMGAAAAGALAKRIESMSEDDARKAYLATVSG